jgi:hypothetical protein
MSKMPINICGTQEFSFYSFDAVYRIGPLIPDNPE